MKVSPVAAVGAGMALPALGVLARYRRDMNAARARLAAVDRRRTRRRPPRPTHSPPCSTCWALTGIDVIGCSAGGDIGIATRPASSRKSEASRTFRTSGSGSLVSTRLPGSP